MLRARLAEAALQAFRLGLAAALLLYVRLAYGTRVDGRLPRRAVPTLVVSNHAHDLEGLLLPAVLLLGRPLSRRVHPVASQRLFEPGFLATRSPRWLRPLVKRWNVGPVLRALGVLPIENMPRRRPLASFAYEIWRRRGDLPLKDILDAGALEPGGPLSGARDIDRVRLRDLWGRRAQLGQLEVSPRDLRSPYREEVQRALRPRVERQLEEVERALRRGGTVYLTPEGRMTSDGRMGRLREALDRLRPAARCLVAAAVSFDPWAPGRMRMTVRLAPPPDAGDFRLSLAVLRPLSASHVLAAALHALPAPADEPSILRACRRLLDELPPEAELEPDLARDPDRALGQRLRMACRRGHVARVVSDSGATLYRPRPGARDPRFPDAADIVAYLAAAFEETAQALAILRERRAGAPGGISFVIPARNEASYVGAALESVRAQADTGTAVEAVVVDNASEDDTVGVVARFIEAHPGVPVRLVQEPVPGRSRAKNRGVRAARGEIIVFLDADSRAAPDLAAWVARRARLGAVAESVRVVADSHRPGDRFFFNLLEFGKRRFGIRAQMFYCRRDLFLELGGFREDLHLAEDKDFLERVEAAGHLVGHLERSWIATSPRRLHRWPLGAGAVAMLVRWALAHVGIGRRWKY
ncbi:MAG: glycosyltransferase [Clostridia bacterium]|nr:glycosyltransferase [Clostridia bacterium]